MAPEQDTQGKEADMMPGTQSMEPYRPWAIEGKWRRRWAEANLYRTPETDDAQTFYCLDFFPYPSGEGLSVGHCRNYVPTDVVSRYHRMRGYAVLHPMGWDAFGLPAENEAIKKGVHPHDSTRRYAANYRRQMDLIGASYDWEREISSSNPRYYHWTQWIFLLLYNRGLAYRAMAPVNWCESCQTTLANNEVEQGTCWRCHQSITRRDLEQWFLRITAYAAELHAETYHLDWPEHIVTMQRNWIGRSVGVSFEMAVADCPGTHFQVFTTRPDTVYGITFAALAPEHPLVSRITTQEQRAEVEAYVKQARHMAEIDRLRTDRARKGVFTGAFAVNPLTNRQVPVFVVDYVLMSYGTGAIMGVPAHDQRDFAFAQRYSLPIVEAIRPRDGRWTESRAFEGEGIMVNSGPFDGQPSPEARQRIADMMEQEGYGQRTTQYRMRDWLISRQRYWGTPIPIIYCPQCGTVPVPEDALPVMLPHLPAYKPRGDGRSPLANVPGFVNTTCPNCGSPARRETDTLDGFACSSWYFLRFPDREYDRGPFNPTMTRRWLPVDLYVGGAEHAVMHLLYARFWTKVLADAGLLDFREPFPRLASQGILHAADGKRMSKSQGNVITPDEVVQRHGADTLRIHLLFMAPFEKNVNWDEEGIVGAKRFLQKVWKLCQWTRERETLGYDHKVDTELQRAVHKTIMRVTDDIEAFKFNTAIASMMELVNKSWALAQRYGLTPSLREATEVLIRLLAPFAPHIAEELWTLRGGEFSVHQQPWPTHDPALAMDATTTLVVQVNGKVRDRIEAPSDIGNAEAQSRALGSERVQHYLKGNPPKKIIVVPGRLVNIVV
jgi:leucyl-tRNA synthetase